MLNRQQHFLAGGGEWWIHVFSCACSFCVTPAQHVGSFRSHAVFQHRHCKQGCRSDQGSPTNPNTGWQQASPYTKTFECYPWLSESVEFRRLTPPQVYSFWLGVGWLGFFSLIDKIHQSNFQYYREGNNIEGSRKVNHTIWSNTNTAEGSGPSHTAVTGKLEASVKVKWNVSLLMNQYSRYLLTRGTTMDLVCKLTLSWRRMLSGKLSGKRSQSLAPFVFGHSNWVLFK